MEAAAAKLGAPRGILPRRLNRIYRKNRWQIAIRHYRAFFAIQSHLDVVARRLFRKLNDDGSLARAEGHRWVLLGPVKAYFTTTEGGAAINNQMQVLDADDRPIPGLYAVGQNGLGGMVLWGHGLHIGWAITSGRLVGNHLGKLKA